MASSDSEVFPLLQRSGRRRRRRHPAPSCRLCQAARSSALIVDRSIDWSGADERLFKDRAIYIDGKLAAESVDAGWRELHLGAQVLAANTRWWGKSARSFQRVAPAAWSFAQMAEWLASRDRVFDAWRDKEQPKKKRASKKHLAWKFGVGCETAKWAYTDFAMAAERRDLAHVAEVLRTERSIAETVCDEVSKLRAKADAAHSRSGPALEEKCRVLVRASLDANTKGSNSSVNDGDPDDDRDDSSTESTNGADALTGDLDDDRDDSSTESTYCADVLTCDGGDYASDDAIIIGVNGYVRLFQGQRPSLIDNSSVFRKNKACVHTCRKSYRSSWDTRPRVDAKCRRSHVKAANAHGGLFGPEYLPARGQYR